MCSLLGKRLERGEVCTITLSSCCLWCSDWTVPLLTKEFSKVTVFKGLCSTEYWIVGVKYISPVLMPQKTNLEEFKKWFWIGCGWRTSPPPPHFPLTFSLCKKKRTVFNVFISYYYSEIENIKKIEEIGEYLQLFNLPVEKKIPFFLGRKYREKENDKSNQKRDFILVHMPSDQRENKTEYIFLIGCIVWRK